MISPHKDQWRGALMFSLICVWINGWVNSREAGDLKRHSSHYDVTVRWQLNLNEHYSVNSHLKFKRFQSTKCIREYRLPFCISQNNTNHIFILKIFLQWRHWRDRMSMFHMSYMYIHLSFRVTIFPVVLKYAFEMQKSYRHDIALLP